MRDSEYLSPDDEGKPAIPWKEFVFSENLRLGRASYCMLSLPILFLGAWITGELSTPAKIMDFVIHFGKNFGNLAIGEGGIFDFFIVKLLIVAWCLVSVKRLHDTGSSGLVLIVGFIPVIGLLLLLGFLFLLPGSPSKNRYGYPERLRRYLPCEDEEREKFSRSL